MRGLYNRPSTIDFQVVFGVTNKINNTIYKVSRKSEAKQSFP